MNRESERKRLVELISECCAKNLNMVQLLEFEKLILADHLLSNSIVVPPVKVDSKIYTITSGLVLEYEVFEIRFDSDTMWFWSYNEEYEKDRFKKFIFTKNDIGKTVFTSREEAEKMLKGVGRSESCVDKHTTEMVRTYCIRQKDH